MHDPIQEALAELRPSLNADGFDLRLESIAGDGTVTVALEALPNACLECLVPDHVLVQVLEDAIRRRAPGVQQVRLVKYNFDGAHGQE